ncbi:MAG: hypothetical protein M1132_06920 [Chloroflexi bacterium]|nr:hypothetical protein [Chloroflexota bacterium]MCL5951437.1 hypothetical protein [Chloroflexota bacterium]
MHASITHVTSGHIIAVQEERFRVLTDDGQGLVLSLAHDVPLDSSDLAALQAAGAHVIVRYTGRPNLEMGTAHSIRSMSPAE